MTMSVTSRDRDNCVVSYGVGHWYPRGMERLRNSVFTHTRGKMDVITYTEHPEGCPSHVESPYAFKPYVINLVRQMGYKNILWCDASVWAVRDPSVVFSEIEAAGYCYFHNGYNCAQTASDRMLKRLGIGRDAAEKMPELTGCCMGWGFGNSRTCAMFDEYYSAAMDKVFAGNWRRDPTDSTDPRFLFCRHDQSYASLLCGKYGLTYKGTGNEGDWFSYWRHDMHQSVVFTNQGM